VNETTHPGVTGFPIIDEAGFDGFKWRHGEDGFDDTGAEAGEHSAGAGDVPSFVREEAFETVEGEKADTGFDGVADNEGCATSVPFRAKFRPRDGQSVSSSRVVVMGREEVGTMGASCHRVGGG